MSSACIRFDHGTLRIVAPGAATLPHVLWDERVHAFRAPAFRHREVTASLRRLPVDDPIAGRIRRPTGPWRAPTLRGYQEDALRSLRAFHGRGVAVLPTGSGKTRLAIALLAGAKVPSLVLAPTRVLVEQWREEIARWYDGPIGVVSDGDRRVEDVTVMTFASAYATLDEHGDRFGALVVDEAHHFAGGLRAEALEMCVARIRLGLTATAPAAGSPGGQRLVELIGPTVCEIRVNDLLGTHLANLTHVQIGVGLAPDEWAEYAPAYAQFSELRSAFFRGNPSADWQQCLRSLGATAAGRAAIRGYHRAVAIASFPREKREVVARLLARHTGDRTLVFTATADDAYAIATDNLIPVITAEVGRAERAEILTRYRDGRFRAIVSARVLNEGVDVPDAAVAILVAGALGEREYVQRIGRVLRPSPGKTAVAYDLVATGTLDDARARRRGGPLAA